MASKSISNGFDPMTEFVLRFREFTITTYHNLPNTILVASLLLGSIQGNFSMVWVAIGMILNTFVTMAGQELLGLIFHDWDQVKMVDSNTCSIIPKVEAGNEHIIVAPSYWFSGTTYFVIFVLYNAIQVAMRPPAQGTSQEKYDIRIAFTMSVILISILFFLLLLLRGFTGCETWLGSILGILFGAGVAIGYWHLLNICNTGIPPDILNIVSATAPSVTNKDTETPVICTA